MTVPALTLSRAFTAWMVQPFAVVLVLALGVLYALGIRAVRRRGGRWPRSRALAFYLVGLGTAVLVTMSSVGVYSHVLFSMRAVQVVVLLMVTPLGLALGSPVTLLQRVIPSRRADAVRRVLASRAARALTFPLVTSVLLVVTPFVLYLTSWYEAALRSTALDQLTLLSLAAIGFLYFWTRLQVDPVPRRFPQLLSLLISLVEVIGDGILGLVLWLGPRIVAVDYYTELARHWGPSLRTDQIIGAGVLWILGDLAGLPFLGASLRRMTKEDAEEAAKIDKELDEHIAELESTSPTAAARRTGARPTGLPEESTMDRNAGTADGMTEKPVLMRPWWEDDPVLRERFRRQR